MGVRGVGITSGKFNPATGSGGALSAPPAGPRGARRLNDISSFWAEKRLLMTAISRAYSRMMSRRDINLVRSRIASGYEREVCLHLLL